jgi:hypothetical protein
MPTAVFSSQKRRKPSFFAKLGRKEKKGNRFLHMSISTSPVRHTPPLSVWDSASLAE